MDLIEYFGLEIDGVHRMLDLSMRDLDDEIAHAQPGGTANSIASILAHVVTAEDYAIQHSIKGGRPLHESAEWAGKLGLPEQRPMIWQPGWRLNLPAFDGYRQVVATNVKDCILNLSQDDLDREVPWFRGTHTIGSLIRVVLTSHIFGHTGEISALKGVRGLNGLPI